MYGWDKDCLILIPFRLPQISSFTLSLKCFSSDSDNWPTLGIGPLLQFPPPAEGRSSPTNTPVFPPSSFVLPSFAWFYVFFSTGQVLLSTLSFCIHFCVWRCILDVSMERDIFHIHLPPQPPPSCSPLKLNSFLQLNHISYNSKKNNFWNSYGGEFRVK